MTYHPKTIMITALFFATKSEPYYISLDRFVGVMDEGSRKKGTITQETVLAAEFVLMQGLRFSFDVKHPYRALRGVHIEMLSMSQGTAALPPHEKRTPAQLQQELRVLKTKSGSTSPVKQRIDNAYAGAKELIDQTGILTDAYFFYTPSQICFAALFLIDEPLTTFYLSTKFPSSANAIRVKVLATIRQCSELLSEGPMFKKISKEELIRIDKKLYQCQNPEKLDLVSLNKAVKRDDVVDGQLDETQAKKRKLEREKAMTEGDDLFGPDLATNGAKNGG